MEHGDGFIQIVESVFFAFSSKFLLAKFSYFEIGNNSSCRLSFAFES
jgi:hypothetical protein